MAADETFAVNDNEAAAKEAKRLERNLRLAYEDLSFAKLARGEYQDEIRCLKRSYQNLQMEFDLKGKGLNAKVVELTSKILYLEAELADKKKKYTERELELVEKIKKLRSERQIVKKTSHTLGAAATLVGIGLWLMFP